MHYYLSLQSIQTLATRLLCYSKWQLYMSYDLSHDRLCFKRTLYVIRLNTLAHLQNNRASTIMTHKTAFEHHLTFELIGMCSFIKSFLPISTRITLYILRHENKWGNDILLFVFAPPLKYSRKEVIHDSKQQHQYFCIWLHLRCKYFLY